MTLTRAGLKLISYADCEVLCAILTAATWKPCLNWSLTLPFLEHRREMMFRERFDAMIRKLVKEWDAGVFT